MIDDEVSDEVSDEDLQRSWDDCTEFAAALGWGYVDPYEAQQEAIYLSEIGAQRRGGGQ